MSIIKGITAEAIRISPRITKSAMCSFRHFLLKYTFLSSNEKALDVATSMIFSSAFCLKSSSAIFSPARRSLIPTSNTFESYWSISISGIKFPFSQRETVLLVTPNFSPNSSCVTNFYISDWNPNRYHIFHLFQSMSHNHISQK